MADTKYDVTILKRLGLSDFMIDRIIKYADNPGGGTGAEVIFDENDFAGAGTEGSPKTVVKSILDSNDFSGSGTDLDKVRVKKSVLDPAYFVGVGTVEDKIIVKLKTVGGQNVYGLGDIPINAASQTPWLANIDAGGFTLENLKALEVLIASGGVNTYATIDPAGIGAGGIGYVFTLSMANLKATANSGEYGLIRSTIGKSSLKWSFEVTVGAGAGANQLYAGFASAAAGGFYLGNDTEGWGFRFDGNKVNGLLGFESYGSDCTAPGTVLTFLYDNGTISVKKDGVSMGVMYSGLTGNIFPAIGAANTTADMTVNFGATSFVHPESGFNNGYYTTAGGGTTTVIKTDEATGEIGIGTNPISGQKVYILGNSTVNGLLTLANGIIKMGLFNTVPSSSDTAGAADVGTIVFDANYMYLCTAINTWKRVALGGTW